MKRYKKVIALTLSAAMLAGCGGDGGSIGGESGAIGGTTGDSYFGKNQGQTKEKKLSRLTTIACAVFAVVAIAAYIICS